MRDATQLKRTVAVFQRRLGAIFGNASARRRNRRYELAVAVYEKPGTVKGKPYRMPDRQILLWVKNAADQAHPRLHRRMRVGVQPWRPGTVTKKPFAPVTILVDATQYQIDTQT